ncbi:MAG TPA: alpha/beta hydrolase [Chloroflexota bacterium]|nr:alpha/beta hydrolase [Chloroflexota bacterium]
MTQLIANTAKGPIEYRLEGEGPVVMVLNGGHCSRESRLSHERLAAHGFSVLTPSRPGYDSTPSSVGRTAQAAADALAALLDTLQIPAADVIGISAAGPTALAFAQQHPGKTGKLLLESAVTLPWDEGIKKQVRLGFGRAERVTWGMLKLALRLRPMMVMRMILRELTCLDVDEVIQRMGPDDLLFVRRMIETSQSGTGFMNDIEHQVPTLAGITAPVLVLYSPHDKSVPPENGQRVAAALPSCELVEVPADTHLIWIGRTADEVWQKRLSFLNTPA